MFSIEKKDKRWLQAEAQVLGISMAELIRRSIRHQMCLSTPTSQKDQIRDKSS